MQVENRDQISAGCVGSRRVRCGGAGVGRGVGGHPPGQATAEKHAAQTQAGRE